MTEPAAPLDENGVPVIAQHRKNFAPMLRPQDLTRVAVPDQPHGYEYVDPASLVQADHLRDQLGREKGQFVAAYAGTFGYSKYVRDLVQRGWDSWPAAGYLVRDGAAAPAAPAPAPSLSPPYTREEFGGPAAPPPGTPPVPPPPAQHQPAPWEGTPPGDPQTAPPPQPAPAPAQGVASQAAAAAGVPGYSPPEPQAPPQAPQPSPVVVPPGSDAAWCTQAYGEYGVGWVYDQQPQQPAQPPTPPPAPQPAPAQFASDPSQFPPAPTPPPSVEQVDGPPPLPGV